MPDTVFAVHRVNWLRTTDGWLRLPGTTRLVTFDDPSEADAERRHREEAARRAVNPFRCGGLELHYQTSFDADRLHDWLMDAGVEPPRFENGKRDWPAWWDTHSQTLTPSQWSRVWEGLDRLRFFETVPSPRRPVMYAVVRVHWEYNDNWYEAEPEGGTPIKAFRSRERAEAACREANQQARGDYRLDIGFEITHRARRQRDPFTDPPVDERGDDQFVESDDVPFCEVVELEWEP